MHPCCAPIAPLALLRRAIAHDGAGGRLAKLLGKLRRRKAITVVVLGGSICTNDYAGCTHTPGDGGGGGGGGGGACAANRGWARMVVDVLNAVWPPASPGTSHAAVALGRTGSAADTFVDCLTTHLGNLTGRTRRGDDAPPVDLFLLEFAINGASSSGSSAAPLDALVRRLLSLIAC